jgi:hypothetical protein
MGTTRCCCLIGLICASLWRSLGWRMIPVRGFGELPRAAATLLGSQRRALPCDVRRQAISVPLQSPRELSLVPGPVCFADSAKVLSCIHLSALSQFVISGLDRRRLPHPPVTHQQHTLFIVHAPYASIASTHTVSRELYHYLVGDYSMVTSERGSSVDL